MRAKDHGRSLRDAWNNGVMDPFVKSFKETGRVVMYVTPESDSFGKKDNLSRE